MGEAKADIYDYRPLGEKAANAAKSVKGLIGAIDSGDAGKIACASGGVISSAGLVVAVIPCGKCQVVGGVMIGAGALVSALTC